MNDNQPKYEFKNVKVSRLPPLPEPLDPIITELFEDTASRGGSILNLHLTKAHAPKLQAAGRHITRALRNECDAPRVLREIAILRASILVGCAYEEHHHRPLARGCRAHARAGRCGQGTGGRRRICSTRSSRRCWPMWISSALNKGDVDDATFAAMEKHFSPQEIVELTMCATSYYGGGHLHEGDADPARRAA